LLRSFKTNLIFLIKDDLKRVSLNIIQDFNFWIKTKDDRNFNEKIKLLEKYTGFRTTIIKKDGKVIFDSSSNPESMENHADRPEVIESIEKGEGFSIRKSPTLNQFFIYFALLSDNKEYIIRLSTNYEKYKEFTKYFKNLYLSNFLIFLLFSLFMIFLFLYIYFLSLSIIKEKVCRILIALKSHETNNKISFKNLPENLDLIREKIEEKIKSNKLEEKVEKIVDFIEIPFVVLDKEGKIELFNRKFKEIFENVNSKRYYWEVIDNYEINEILDETFENRNKTYEKEIDYGSKYYLCRIKYFEEDNKVFLILSDITEFKNLKEVKKTLIENLSHELKTPLSVIKGYIETLYEEIENQSHKNFLDIVNKHTERLIEILEKMLILSKMETENIDLENVDIKEIIRNIYHLYEKKSKEKNIEFILNIEESLPRIKVDKLKIEHALINVVDNAFKFTEKGKIEINVRKIDRYIMIEIKDTGIGMSEEETERIFERFYTIDKGRTKKNIGIGLSIVKNIINKHSGKIKVESKLGGGTSIQIFLPV